MKNAFLSFIILLLCHTLAAQDKTGAEKLVDEGVHLNQMGDFTGAIAKYEKALELDKDNLLALAEKAHTLIDLGRYDEAISYCQMAIEKHPGEEILQTVYVNHGTALDLLKNAEGALAKYDEGIKLFPNYFYLYFNKGITLSDLGRSEEAIKCFKKSIALNHAHPGSLSALANEIDPQTGRVPCLLAYWLFLLMEPEGERAKANMEKMLGILDANLDGSDKKKNASKPTISPTPSKEDNFSSVELELSNLKTKDFKERKTRADKFVIAVRLVCSSLREAPKDNGFFWQHFAPFFIEMEDKRLTEPFAYIVLLSWDDDDVIKWIEYHHTEVDKFYDWAEAFQWKTN